MGAETDTYRSSANGGLALDGAPAWTPPAIEVVTSEGAPARPDAATPMPSGAVGIKALLCDVDDVLFDASAWSRWLAQIFARLSPRSLEVDFARFWQEEFLPPVYRGRQEFHAAFAGCLTAIGLAPGLVEEIVAASRAQRRREQTNGRPFPGVRATLVRLQEAGVARAVFANTDRSAGNLSGDLARLGLGGLFDHILSSIDLSFSVADSQCYDLALATLNCSAAEVLFVGHGARDLRAAQSAGLAAVAFNARQTIPGIASIERFEELIERVLPVPAAGTPVQGAV